MPGSEMSSLSSDYQQRHDKERRHYIHTQCLRPNSRQYCNAARTFSRHNSFSCSGILISLLYVVSLCPRACDGGVNCSDYDDVNCQHGTCSVRLPSKGDNHTLKVDCVCDDRWSGPACDVFSCKGRTL